MKSWKSALFREHEIVAFKEVQQSAKIELAASEHLQFFCINPLRTPANVKLENIAEHRNFLIEFDGMASLEEQWLYVEEKRIPWATCTYSGGKSLHFIIALTEDLGSELYHHYSEWLVRSIKGADPTAKNANRLSRTPEALRLDSGLKQELLEVRAPITADRMVNWILFGPLRKQFSFIAGLMAKEKAEAALRAQQQETCRAERLPIPRIYRDMQTDGALHPECIGRHESLTKFGVWLRENGYEMDEVEVELQLAADGMGIGDRPDVKGLMRWLF